MFKRWIILTNFALILASAVAEDFLVINCPDSLQFEASPTVLRLGQVKFVYNAIVGAAATGVSTFSTFKIKNVFKLPHLAFLMVIKTDVEDKIYTDVTPVAVYPVEGRRPIINLLVYDKEITVYSLDIHSKEKKYTNLELQLLALKFTDAKLFVQELHDLLATGKAKLVKVNIKKQKFVSVHLDYKENILEFGRFKDTINKLKPLLKEYFFGVLVYGPDNANITAGNDTTITVIDGTELEVFISFGLYCASNVVVIECLYSRISNIN
ncbi:uncharacterized protein [Eurosta solidaginis]|uniref:uncharacterized protein isoform X2 n=1 Tax=Eurosta solidaginis TaxID=178769 RepID=UPI0035310777